MNWVSELRDAITKGDAKRAETTAREALAAKVDPRALLADGLISAMQAVDLQFQCKDCEQPELCYVPEQLIVNRAIRTTLEIVRPALGGIDTSGGPRVVIGTVEGDRCDLGRDLVAPLLQGRGFALVDLGTSVPLAHFVEAAAEAPATILVLYTRKLSSLESMKRLKQMLAANPSAADAKLLVVGHQINEQVCQEIGADDFCSAIQAAIERVTALAGGRRKYG